MIVTLSAYLTRCIETGKTKDGIMRFFMTVRRSSYALGVAPRAKVRLC